MQYQMWKGDVSNFGFFIALYSEKIWCYIFTCNFWIFWHRRRKIMTCLKLWENSESVTYAFMQTRSFQNLTIFDLTLTWPKLSWEFKLDDAIGSNGHHYRYERAKWCRKHVSSGLLTPFIFSNLNDLISTLTFLSR